jgi:[ribosomal protein S5]-alanine N-acetyltransferase
MAPVTGKILLRDFVESDRPAFAAYHSDPRFLALGGPDGTGPNVTALFDSFVEWVSERPRRHYQLAIVEASNRQALVGCGGLRGVGPDCRAELGIELGPAYWGRFRYAIDAVHGLLAFGFGDLGLQEIYGRTTSANIRATRLARWFGAVPGIERPGPDCMRARGEPEMEWRIARKTWRSVATRRASR